MLSDSETSHDERRMRTDVCEAKDAPFEGITLPMSLSRKRVFLLQRVLHELGDSPAAQTQRSG
jgi:hypothetical protein